MKARWGLAQQHFGQSEPALFSHPKQALAATSLPLVGSQARDSRALFSWLVWVGSPGSGPGFPPGKRTAVFMDLPARLHRPGVWALHGSLLLPMCDSPTFSGDVPRSTHHSLPELLTVATCFLQLYVDGGFLATLRILYLFVEAVFPLSRENSWYYCFLICSHKVVIKQP